MRTKDVCNVIRMIHEGQLSQAILALECEAEDTEYVWSQKYELYFCMRCQHTAQNLTKYCAGCGREVKQYGVRNEE